MNEYEKDVEIEAYEHYIRDKTYELNTKEYIDERFRRIIELKRNIAINKLGEVLRNENSN